MKKGILSGKGVRNKGFAHNSRTNHRASSRALERNRKYNEKKCCKELVSPSSLTETAPLEVKEVVFRKVLISYAYSDNKGQMQIGNFTDFETEKEHLSKEDISWLEEELSVMFRLANLKIISVSPLEEVKRDDAKTVTLGMEELNLIRFWGQVANLELHLEDNHQDLYRQIVNITNENE